MNLRDYKPTSSLDFEILLDKWVDHHRKSFDLPNGKSKEELLKEIMVEAFEMGLQAGKMEWNRPINLGGVK